MESLKSCILMNNWDVASIQYVLSKLSTQARLETSLYHNSFNDKQTPFSFGGLGSFFVCVEVLHLLACPMCGLWSSILF